MMICHGYPLRKLTPVLQSLKDKDVLGMILKLSMIIALAIQLRRDIISI
jgi:hypothetical protein